MIAVERIARCLTVCGWGGIEGTQSKEDVSGMAETPASFIALPFELDLHQLYISL